MGLDPIGTPRRIGSNPSPGNGLTGISTPYNVQGGQNTINGFHGMNGYQSTNSTGSRFFSNGHSSNNIAVVSPDRSDCADLYTRFEQLKSAEISLLEDVFTRYRYLQQKYQSLEEKVEQDQYYVLAGRLQTMLERDAFMLILVQGDAMIFEESLIRLGEAGGRRAADMLENAVNEWARSSLHECPTKFKIATRVFANVKGLAETCQRAGFVSSAEVVEDFVRGFTTHSNELFNFIDVGQGPNSADIKMKAELEAHIHNFQCRHIFVGSSDDPGLARFLQHYVTAPEVTSRVTLLEGVPFTKEFQTLHFNKKKFGGIFRGDKIHFRPDLPGDNPRLRQDSRSTFNPASGVFTPASRTPAPETPLFSPLSRPGLASPAPSLRSSLTRTNSLASSNAVSETPVVVPNGSVGGGSGWANIARGSAHLPFKDLTRTPTEPKVVGLVIRQNKNGQRIDPPMDYDHIKVYELKKQKYCNQHYIGKGCCHWEAGNGACPHKHEANLSKDDLKWLRVVARETVCKKGTGCLEVECIYGHHCPYPPATEGSLRGGTGCINGEKCRFAREMHAMDTAVAKLVRPDGQQ